MTLLTLSRIIPVLMRTTYRVDGRRYRATWVQWRNRTLWFRERRA